MAERKAQARRGSHVLVGSYSPPRSRDSCTAYVAFTASGEITLDTGFAQRRFGTDEVKLSPLLWDGRRCVAFPDAGRFYPHNIEKAGAAFGGARPAGPASDDGNFNARLVAGVFVGGALLWTLAFWLLLPILSEPAAAMVPGEFAASLDFEGLGFLDGHLLGASKLDNAQRARVEKLFAKTTAPWSGGFKFRLLLRSGGMIGPNALALPAGTVVCTDELVKLAESDAELAAVLAHEVGHVVRRHAMRNLMQGETLSLILRALIGRVWKSEGLETALPKLLVKTGYSRAFELEADRFSRDFLVSNRMDPAAFGKILRRLAKTGDGEAIPSFIRTHPPLEERLGP